MSTRCNQNHELGVLISDSRHSAHLTQIEVAHALSHSESRYRAYEAGIIPPIDTLLDIGILLEIPICTLLSAAYPQYKDYINSSCTLDIPEKVLDNLHNACIKGSYRRMKPEKRLLLIAIDFLKTIAEFYY